MPKNPSPPEDKLDAILRHLENIDRRDRLRLWGSFLRGLLALIPLIVFLLGTWYLVKHGDELLKEIVSETAKQTAKYAGDSSADALKQLESLFKK